uniref:Uncharacterized protein n=1 Tax=Arundo donax TaxID=35708 RepID=A0A0A9DY96_ARUDO
MNHKDISWPNSSLIRELESQQKDTLKNFPILRLMTPLENFLHQQKGLHRMSCF